MTLAASLDSLHRAFGNAAFTRTDAQAAGVSPDRLERAVSRGRVARLRIDTYALASDPDRDRWEAARLRARQLHEDGVPAVVSGASAAWLWDVPIVGASPDATAMVPSVIVPPESGVRDGVRHGVRTLHSRLDAEDVARSPAGDLVTSPLRTALDVVRHLRLPVTGAACALALAQRRHVASPPHGIGIIPERDTGRALEDSQFRADLARLIIEALQRCPRRGHAWVLNALDLADPRVETVLEAVSWVRIALAGMPPPIPQAWIRGASGAWYRVDFWWEEFNVVGEADGEVKYRSSRDIMEEKKRHADIESAGPRIVRWTPADAWGEATFIERLQRAFLRRAS